MLAGSRFIVAARQRTLTRAFALFAGTTEGKINVDDYITW
jgi:hypothetical protein